jgi:hypothetical protein
VPAKPDRVVQRLFDVLKADERVLGTSQLAAAPTIRLNNEDSINAVSIGQLTRFRNEMPDAVELNLNSFRTIPHVSPVTS